MSLPNILRVGKEVKPLPGTGVIVERTDGRVARLALTCTVCHETVYDFLGIAGEKLVPGRRRKLLCPVCVKSYEQKLAEWRARFGYAFYGSRTRINTHPKYPTAQFIAIREE